MLGVRGYRGYVTRTIPNQFINRPISGCIFMCFTRTPVPLRTPPTFSLDFNKLREKPRGTRPYPPPKPVPPAQNQCTAKSVISINLAILYRFNRSMYSDYILLTWDPGPRYLS